MADYAALIDDEPQPKKSDNPYLSLVEGEESDSTTRRQQNVLGAVGSNPDQYALSRQIEKHLGIPAPVADRNFPEAERKFKINQMDHVLRGNPELARQMERPEFAKLAHDHAQQVGDILNGAGSLKEIKRSRLEQMGDAFRGGFAKARQSVTIMANQLGLYDGADAEFATRVSEQERIAQRYNAAPDVQAGLERISKAETMGEALLAILEEPAAVLDTTIRSFGASSPSLLAAAGGSVVGPFGTAAGAGLGSFAVEFSNTVGDVLQERGVDFRDPYALSKAFNDPEIMAAAREKATKRGIAIGAFDALTAGMAGKLLAGAKPTMRSIAPRVAGELGVQAAGGMAGEATAQAVTGEYKPGEILMEGFAELPTGIVEVRSNWRHARDAAVRGMLDDYSKASTATKGEVVLNDIINQTAQAPLLERGPDVFAQALNDAASEGMAVSEIHINARQLATVFNQDPIKVAETLGIDAETLDSALASNGDVSVPVGEFVTALAADPTMRPLVEHAKLGVGEMSAAEAREWESKQGDAFRQEAERVLTKRQAETEFSQSAQEVEDFVLAELQKTGRFTESVNKADAALHKAFAVAMGDRLGVKPMDFFKQHMLRVIGDKVVGDQFDQAGKLVTDTPAFRNWFGDSKVVDAEGKPLVVYHGTRRQFNEFVPMKPRGAYGNPVGIYFSSDKSEAEQFAEDVDGATDERSRVVPVYLSIRGEADGIIRKRADGSTEYIVFDPTRIKSATGNNGQFNPNDPNILHQSANREAYRWQHVGEGQNGPVFVGQDFALVPVRSIASETDFEPGGFAESGIMGHAAHVTPDSTTYLFKITDRKGNHVGELVADVLDNTPVAIHDIEVYAKSKGLGTQIAATLAANTEQVRVVEIIQQSEKFWESVGVQSTDQYHNGSFDWQGAQSSLARRSGKTAPGSAGLQADRQGFGSTESADGSEITLFQSGIDQTETPEFKRWSNGNKLVTLDESHSEFFKADEPVVVQALHGTTGDFTIFDQSKANPESDMGGGFYFTNTPEDVSNNYAGEGPDLTQKIQLTAERIASETDREYDDPDVVAEAKAQLSVQHGGMAMPVWVRFDNPVVLGGNKETQFTYSYPYDEATDEYGEETGTLVDFIVALRNAAGQYNDGSVDEAIDALLQKAQDYEQISASELVQTLKDVEEFAYYTDDNGNVVRDEIVRQAFEGAGFDGVIDQTVADKFGVNRKQGQKMLDVGDSTVHFIAFTPEQIKSSIGNNGQFDPNNPDILAQPSGTGNRGSFNPDTNTIALLQNADLSTFLHESGHYFLEVIADVASQPNAPAQIRQDFDTLLQWFNVPATPEASALDTWAMMSLEEKRQYHEQFARGFEAYLYEGKAPSVELQGLFSRFRAWLINVYKSLTALNVELTDEVRGVMDRLVATDEQIATAEAARRFAPIFQTAEQAGMTAEEWAAYQGEHQQATDDAAAVLESRSIRDMRWLTNAKTKRMKELQKASAALRSEVEMAVRAEVMSQPVYQAWQFLTGKAEKAKAKPKADPKVLDPTVDSLHVAIAKLGGIDKLEIVQTWGTDPADIKGLPRPVFGMPIVRTNDGKTIDELAQRLGDYGYIPLDEHGKADVRDLEDAFALEMRGTAQYSVQKDYAAEIEPVPHFDLENYPHGKLDRAAVNLFYGTENEIPGHLDALKMLGNEGYAPDAVANEFGFTSGDDMMRQLAAAQAPEVVIEGMTDQRMLENYGDLSSPEAVERAAEAAIHNDVRARFLTRELNALRTATGKATVLLKAARSYAEQRIAGLKVKDAVKSAPHRAAEARSARGAEGAMKAGDIETAAVHKRDQVLNHELARASLNAQTEVQSILQYLKRFDKDSTRKALDADYRDQIDALLEKFDLRKSVSEKVLAKRKSLADWIDKQVEMGIDPVVDERLINDTRLRHYKDVSLEELRGLKDTVANIEHLGRLKNQLLTAQKNRNLAAAADEIVKSIFENGKGRKPSAEPIGDPQGIAIVARWGKQFAAMHRKFASIARQLDGMKDGGAVWEYFIRSMNDAGNAEADMRAAMSEKLANQFEKIKHVKLTRKEQVLPGVSLTRENMLVMALNWGNEGNRQRLMDGGLNDTVKQLTQPQIESILDRLTKEEWDFVQGVWDMLEENRPLIAAQERRLTGVEPKWVEPAAVQTKHGTYRGGYYPAKYDGNFSTRSNELEAITDLRQQMQGAGNRAQTRKGYTQARAGEVTGRPLKLALSTLTQHANEVAHRLAWQDWLIDTNRLLKRNDIDSAIREHYGPHLLAEIRDTVRDIAVGDVAASNALERGLNHIRTGATIAGLGWNITTSLLQPLGLTQSMVRIGYGPVGRGLMSFVGSPLKTIEAVEAKSKFMQHRGMTMNREINDVINRIRNDKMSRIEGSFFYMIQAMQKVADMPTWLGRYEQALTAGEDESRAIALADQAVIDAQGAGQLKDLAKIQRGSPALKLFTNFYSYFNTTYNLAVERSKATDYSNPLAVGKLAVDYLMLFSVPAVLGSLLKSSLKGDWEDDEDKLAKKLAKEQLNYLFGTMVLLREVGGAFTGNFGYEGPAGLRVFAALQKLVKQAEQGEVDKDLVKALINVGGVVGVPGVGQFPSGQVNRTIDGVVAVSEGKAGPTAVIFGPPPKN